MLSSQKSIQHTWWLVWDECIQEARAPSFQALDKHRHRWLGPNTIHYVIESTLIGLIICRLENMSLNVVCHWVWGGFLYHTIAVIGNRCRQWLSFFRCWIFLHSVIFSLSHLFPWSYSRLCYYWLHHLDILISRGLLSDYPLLSLLFCCVEAHIMLCALCCLVPTNFHILASPSFPHPLLTQLVLWSITKLAYLQKSWERLKHLHL